jgi:cell division protein FtsL
MMLDESTARDLTALTQPETTAPQVQPEIHKAAQPAPQAVPRQHVAFSVFEKAAVVALGLVAVALCTLIVSSKIALASTQRNLENVGRSITKVESDTTDYKQEVNELMQTNHLDSVASKDGLKLNEANIRNVK